MTEDPGIGSEVKSYDDLVVGLPADNLTILGLARKLADQVQRPSLSAESARDDERARVKDAVRYHPTKTERLWTTGISKHGGVETKSHLFAMADGLMTNALWLRPIGASDTVAATIVLDARERAQLRSRLRTDSTGESRCLPRICLSTEMPGAMTARGCWSK